MKVKIFLRDIDLFKFPKEDYAYGSSFSGLLSIVTVILMMTVSALWFHSVSKGATTPSKTENNHLIASKIIVPQFVVEIKSKSSVINLDSYFSFFVSQRLNINGIRVNQTDYYMQNDVFNINGRLVNGYSSNITYYLQGTYDQYTYRYISINIVKCVNGTNENIICKSSEDIEHLIRFSTNTVDLWVYDQSRWDKISWINPTYQSLASGWWTGVELYFEWDKDVVSQKYIGTKSYTYPSLSSSTVRGETAKYFTGSLLTFYFQLNLDGKETTYNKYQLIDWLLDVGAFISLGFVVTRSIGFLYNKFKYNNLKKDDPKIGSIELNDTISSLYAADQQVGL